ncbi:hypothetical protein Tco_1477248 [Tanacetum coccineum]
MTTLADKSLLSGGDNKPPMLEKHLYDSWKSRMELYMMNRPHGRMILASVEKGPLVWPSITEDGVTRLKEYVELTPAEAIQADCEIKAINIILQGLPIEIYALVSQHRVAKDLWEKIKLLMQGTSLTKQERECKLYDEFDKFTYKKGESLHEYYLRFTLLLNDMNIYKMPLEHFKLIPSSLNNSSDEMEHNFVPVFQKGDDPIDAINHMMSFLTAVVTSWYPTTNNQLRTSSNPRQQATIYDGKVTVQPVSGRNKLLMRWNNKKINTPDALTEVHNPDNLNYDLFNQSEQIMMSSEQSNDVGQTETDITSDSNIIPYSQYLSETQQETVQNSNSSAQQDVLILSMFDQLSTQAFDQVVKERTTATAITEATWGLLIKWKLAVEQHRLESRTFEVKMNQVLSENERLLAQAIDKDIVKTVVNLSVNASGETVNECQKCLELKTELLNKKDL